MSHEELTDMDEYAEARAMLGRALGEEPTMNFHPTSVLAAAKRSVARGRAWAAGGIAAGVVVIGIGGAALASPFGAAEVPPAGGVTTTSTVPSTITVSPTETSRPTIPTTPPATTRPPVTSTQTTTSPGKPDPTTSRPVPTTTRPAPTTTSLPATTR
ncbi:hypothetical protein NLX83_07925 [Allokutzneria sp. A3M-2-11 16]|uniref:hypothetical protein n=1 Tax=Allokutzneria sp. A3M-2-11 16 TaxID=2962043 RepID=UPI0020B6D98E|nr:hypothetical protein [Allokutzneria sp. A3M-2-11 16]MCP3799181.1 hypothetical protein [Allokutzneria sp. A3M-2-11 16]